MKILNFGSCNIDSVYSVPHIVSPGETLAAVSMAQFPGGKGLNQAISIAKAGAPVYFAGCIGETDTMLRPILKAAGVDMTYLKAVKEPTGQAIIQVDENGENSIFIYAGANGAVSTEQIDEVLSDFAEGDLLLLQNEISNLMYLIEKAAAKGMKIILNPSPFVPALRNINLDDLYLVIVNETEASEWADSEQPFDFLTLVQAKHPSLNVILTLGKKGSIFLSDGKLYRQQSYKATTVDTTAAGDTFTGYFVSGLYKGQDIPTILRTASAASAIAISKEGAASSIPTRKEVEAVIDSMVLNASDDIEEQMQLVQSTIVAHIADVELGDIALLLGYTKDHTGHWINKHFGMNFSELLQKERCHVAADYLKNTDMPVAQIIQLVGYSNESFFRTIFQKHFKLTPSKYRQTVRKTE